MSTNQLAQFFEIVPIGIFSGLLSGAFGIGGGIVSTPLVRHFLGVTAHVAIGSTLAVILPTAIVGSINYLKQGKLIPKLALVCGVPAALGTIAASYASHFVEGQQLMLVLAGLMIVVALDFLTGFGQKLRSHGEESDEAFKIELNSKQSLIGAALGLFVGLLSGFLGIGGGFIMVPAFCYLLNLPLKVAFGTSLLIVAVVAMPGTFVHAMHGHVSTSIVIPMVVGSVPGAWLGSYFSLKAKDRWLRVIFGAIVLIMAIVFAYRELYGSLG